nr:ethylene-responsive transcription factor 2-like [Lolium perenne]
MASGEPRRLASGESWRLATGESWRQSSGQSPSVAKVQAMLMARMTELSTRLRSLPLSRRRSASAPTLHLSRHLSPSPADAPPPRRRPPSGYHGVRARPSGRFDAEIRSGEERIRLGTFDTAHEAARAYDAVAWRLGSSRRQMNFHDVFTREQAEMLAPPPPMITREQQHLLIAERDEALRVEWARRFPEDVAATAAFYAEKEKKEEEKAAEKAKKKASREKRRAESAARKAARAAKRVESAFTAPDFTTPVGDALNRVAAAACVERR